MNDKRKQFQCPKCLTTGWLYREGNELICCQCDHKFLSKRKDDCTLVPDKWEVSNG